MLLDIHNYINKILIMYLIRITSSHIQVENMKMTVKYLPSTHSEVLLKITKISSKK